MAGLSTTGFTPKSTAELKLELETRLVSLFGNVNLSSESVFGQLVGLITDQQTDLWARLEQVYHSQYPGSAAGINLDRVVSINGLTRLASSATYVQAVVTGVLGTVLASGRLATALDGSTYVLTTGVTLSATNSVGARIVVNTITANTKYTITLGGVAYTYNSGVSPTAGSILTNLKAALPIWVTSVLTTGVDGNFLDIEYDTATTLAVSSRLTVALVSNYADFENTVEGKTPLAVGALSTIQTPVSGWTSIYNRFEGSIGRDVESDAELRIRRANSLRLQGSSTLDSIVSALRQVPGVLSTRVRANNGNSTDGEGTAAHTLWAIVDGGDANEIAQVLYEYTAAGIGMRGAQTVNIVSPVNGQAFPVKFDRPTNVPFYIDVTVQGSTATPTDAIDQIRAALVAYANDFDIGEPSYYTRLFSVINPIIGDGAYVSELYQELTASPDATANIVPDPDERLTLTTDRVQVYIV